MFKGKKQTINPSVTDTLIGEGSVFEGRIKSEASIRIEGHLTGDIDCAGDVTIGEKGVVKSNITARDVIIAGQVHGNIHTKGKLTITSTGQLYGNTSSQSFIIEEGAVFQGSSKMEGKGSAAGGGNGSHHESELGGKGFGGPVANSLGGTTAAL
jgi:cytoskeletal protein CcmA (bactofilin family)